VYEPGSVYAPVIESTAAPINSGNGGDGLAAAGEREVLFSPVVWRRYPVGVASTVMGTSCKKVVKLNYF